MQKMAGVKLKLFDKNHRANSLRFNQKLPGPLCSIWINKKYRILGYLDDEEIVWFWTGPHSKYDDMIKKWRSARRSLF